jgi:transposase
MKDLNVVGVDLAKSSFQIHVASSSGRMLKRQKLSRTSFTQFLANSPKAHLFMEACGTSNFWARKARAYGHEVRLIAPQYVKPYVKRHKNDAADAQAICEAATREHMNFVPIKTIEQQDLQSLHRRRELYVQQRTATYNQVRSLLAEYGLATAKGHSHLRKLIADIISAQPMTQLHDLSPLMLEEFRDVDEDLRRLDQKVESYDKKIELHAKNDDRCKRLMSIPGIGPVTATALVAAVGNAAEFKNARQMSAWLGLIPKQNSTGGKPCLGKLSKQGNQYLRTLLIHGGRAVMMNTGQKKDPRSKWADKLKQKVGMNKAAVAMANKNVRTAWAILRRGSEYNPSYKPVLSKKAA